MKIEKIEKNGRRYNLVLDSGKKITTFDDVILKNGLLFHKYINEKLLDKIIKETNYYKSYNKILDMISRRLRSEFEIREYLKDNEIDEDDAGEIIDNLKKIGLIDDRLFARAYTNDKINLSLDGPNKIRKYLIQNKVDSKYIDEAISNIDDEVINNHVDKIIDKKISYNTKYTSYILKQKIMIYLINLGYDKDKIMERLDKKDIKNPNLQKEMDKVLNKLSKKYSGDKLIYNLKGKLYSKGFNAEEIEDYIKNSSLF